tara:strand:+ start:2502 stop:2888 length:387 start_codon:yes stop_codon:yes gene_type:complete
MVYENLCKEALAALMEHGYGWILDDIKTNTEGNVLFDPNFYPVGYRLAHSTTHKSVIVADGKTVVKIRNKIFECIDEAIQEYGFKIMESFNEWEFISDKEWMVLKRNGNWLTCFSTISEIPVRSTLRA